MIPRKDKRNQRSPSKLVKIIISWLNIFFRALRGLQSVVSNFVAVVIMVVVIPATVSLPRNVVIGETAVDVV